jgi:hypothetical protein
MPSRSNYVCVSCELEMRMERSGVVVEEHTDDGRPYKIWSADLWRCPGCDVRLILGFATNPLHHHFDPGYAEAKKSVEFHIRTKKNVGA